MKRALALSLCLAMPSAAQANEPHYMMDGEHVTFEIGLGGGEMAGLTAFGMTAALGGRMGVTDAFGVRGVVPFVYGSLSADRQPGDVSAFLPGNFTVMAELAIAQARNSYMAVSLGVAAPTASVGDPREDFVGAAQDLAVYAIAPAIRGLQDLWLWAPDNVSIVAQFKNTRRSHGMYIDGDVTTAVMISTDDNVDDQVDVVLQARPSVGWDGGIVAVGLGLSAVWIPTSKGSDDFQFGLEPFVVIDPGGVIIDARFTFNLDEPLGPSFSDGSMFGFHTAVTVPL